MIAGIGTDIVEIDRIAEALSRWGERFVGKFCTDREVADWNRSGRTVERLAGRFAAKEAGMKALGVGWGKLAGWKDFEITNNELGGPVLHIKGSAAATASDQGISSSHLSISHSRRSACAVVVLEK